MNFRTLSQNDSIIWLSNLDKTIKLMEYTEELWKIRREKMDKQYKNVYRKGWRKYFYPDSFYIIYDGSAVPGGSVFRCSKKVERLTEGEHLISVAVYHYSKTLAEFKSVQVRWAKYAKQPFEIHESDLLQYQRIISLNRKYIALLKKIGITNEEFNLDEDSRSRG